MSLRVKGLARRWTRQGFMNMLAGCGLYSHCNGADLVPVEMESGGQRATCVGCLLELTGNVSLWAAAMDIITDIRESPPFDEDLASLDRTLCFLPNWRRDVVMTVVSKQSRGELASQGAN